MSKPVRKAVRCYLIKNDKIIVTKYKEPNKKAGYYEIPGGKIEEGELPEQTAIREMQEETGIIVKDLKNKGNLTINNGSFSEGDEYYLLRNESEATINGGTFTTKSPDTWLSFH